MDSADLRPLSIGELLDRTFTLYRRHFWMFVGIMAIPGAFYVPLSLLTLSGQAGRLGPVPTPGAVAAFLLLLAIFAAVFSFAYAVGLGAVTFAVSDYYLGQVPTVRGSYARIAGKLWRVIGVIVNVSIRVLGVWLLGGGAIAMIAVAVAGAMAAMRPMPAASAAFGVAIAIVAVVLYLALVVLLVIWALRYSIAIPALLLENTGVNAAIQRSVFLTKNRKWQIFLAVLLTAIITWGAAIIFQAPALVTMALSGRPGAQPIWLTSIFAVLSAVSNAVTSPLAMIALVLIYYDSRIRKEAFDLRFMLSTLDPAAPAPAPATGTAPSA